MIEIDYKTLKGALDSVLLKGKYSSSTTSKIGVINDCVVAIIESVPIPIPIDTPEIRELFDWHDCKITFANASDVVIAQCVVNCRTSLSREDLPKMHFFDVEKLIHYLKVFDKKKPVRLIFDNGSLEIEQDFKKAKIPLAVEHRAIGFISKLKATKISEDVFPSFGQTPLTTKILVQGEHLADGIKNGSLAGSATYKLEYTAFDEGGRLMLTSANFHKTDLYEQRIPIVSGQGDSAIVEFSAPIDKFCKGHIWIYMTTDKPMMIVGTDRRLVVAPRLRGN